MSHFVQFLAEYHMLFIFGLIVLFSIIETVGGYFANSNRTKDDVLVETINTLALMVLTKPLIFLAATWLMSIIVPGSVGAVDSWPFWIQLLVFLFVDDLLQYWYHRSSHEYKWLWKLHRPHHAAEEMGFLVSYREAVWFYVFMPNIWWLGIFTFLGGGMGVAVGIVLKQVVVVSSHSLATWDSFFYNRPRLIPIVKVLERIFITPAFHHAHHAKSKIDDIGQPNGNFGNMFSIWDQVFGSAYYSHQFPSEYGLQADPKDNWASHVFYPLVMSKKPGSEISKGYTHEKTTVNEPAVLTMAEGDYLYCSCGFSKTQPFCDGAHHGTKHQPIKFTIRKEREYKICQCKSCEKGPFCDDSHLKNIS
jgi:sterol desaturase/sphingolipid hydroxylase (fatty acid hydroxylase superfamily)/CDGSH-type Zn-finger protein